MNPMFAQQIDIRTTRCIDPADDTVKFYWLNAGRHTYSLDRIEKIAILKSDNNVKEEKIVEHSMLFKIRGKNIRKVLVQEYWNGDNIISVKNKYKNRIYSISRNNSGSEIYKHPINYDETFEIY